MERMSVVLLLLVGSAAAQFDERSTVPQVRVQIDFLIRVCDVSTHVMLVGRSGPIAEAVANDRCVVEFANVPAGTYHLSVSSHGFTDTNVGSINASSTGSSDFEVREKRQSDPDRNVRFAGEFVGLCDGSRNSGTCTQGVRESQRVVRTGGFHESNPKARQSNCDISRLCTCIQ